MFCIPTAQKKDRGKVNCSNNMAHDFSQSASALNQISIPGSNTCSMNLCRSDSNISQFKPFSLLSNGVSHPSSNGHSTSNWVASEGFYSNSSFGATADWKYIDGDAEQNSHDSRLEYQQSVETNNEFENPCVNLVPEVSEPNISDPAGGIETQQSPLSYGSLVNNNSIMLARRNCTLPPLAIINHIRSDEDRDPSSSGNSSASDAIVPIASPEQLTPPESGLSSPFNSSDMFYLESTDASPIPKPRFKLLHEGDIQVCFLNHTRTIISKVLSSKFLRRWETHHVYLSDTHISSKTPSGFLMLPLTYSSIEEVYVVHRWDHGDKFCIRLVIPDGSILLQANSAYIRDQWLYSIQWKRNMHKYRSILWKPSRSEVIIKETKNLVDFVVSSPIQDESYLTVPITIVSALLEEEKLWCDRSRREELINVLAPLLEDTPPTTEMSRFFSEHCVQHPRSPVVTQVFTPIVQRILKRNVDFGKSPLMRRFVADFLSAIHSQNNGDEAIRHFINGIHGTGCACPHPRVLPNLVAANLAAIFTHFEERRLLTVTVSNETDSAERSQAVHTLDKQLQCYLTVFLALSELEDWRPGLAALLQPVPFPEEALTHEPLISAMATVLRYIGTDPRCDVHTMVLGVRDGKDGWLHVYCPSNSICSDGGVLWCQMLETLLNCCCRRKSFLLEMVKKLGALQLVALRDHEIAQDALCLLLEWMLLQSEDQQFQAITTLQSTERGKEKYRELCKRQDHLRELQQKGGPRKLTLPSRSTDADVARLLSCGCFGNLECLSLAFTHVTSACANQLIQLPSLRYLNLWATQFGDAGLIIIAEHLDRLQVLNLCETPVSDKGISALVALTSLRKLNLNSTKLTSETLERLKQGLPELQELDVRYTDAW